MQKRTRRLVTIGAVTLAGLTVVPTVPANAETTTTVFDVMCKATPSSSLAGGPQNIGNPGAPIEVTAPATVEPGQEFDVIHIGRPSRHMPVEYVIDSEGRRFILRQRRESVDSSGGLAAPSEANQGNAPLQNRGHLFCLQDIHEGVSAHIAGHLAQRVEHLSVDEWDGKTFESNPAGLDQNLPRFLFQIGHRETQSE